MLRAVDYLVAHCFPTLYGRCPLDDLAREVSPSPPGGISSPKPRAEPPIYDKARSEKIRNPKKKIRSRDDDSDDSDDQHRRGGRKPARPEKVTAPDPLPTRTRNGIDFSGCF